MLNASFKKDIYFIMRKSLYSVFAYLNGQHFQYTCVWWLYVYVTYFYLNTVYSAKFDSEMNLMNTCVHAWLAICKS